MAAGESLERPLILVPSMRVMWRETSAVTGVPIPLEELKYWSVELQEAYAAPEAVLQRYQSPHAPKK